ncbi:MAG: multidrug effflux MFS transporter, partial [Chloroflexi bacterium]|nr:multidrug effflux MFS transporter [Chloroflexota bacterium]
MVASTPTPRSLLILTIILGSVQAIMPMSIDLYLPALPTIANDLQVAAGSVQFTVAVFMIGVALGQVVYGPITDKFGRKTPLLVGFGLYIIGAVICASAPTITWLVVGRFIQALGASAGAVISSAIARDLWSGKMLADRLSLLVLVLGVAPILAPSLGGVILGQWDWHGLFWFLVLYGVAVASAVTFLPETSSTT